MSAPDPRPPVVSRTDWAIAHARHLEREKDLTRLRDALRAERRLLPWTVIDKPYVFDSTAGPVSLAALFAGRSQLIIKHFMFGPGWREGCVGCSFETDHLEAARIHLEHHDVSVVAVSRAPLAELHAFRDRMGWGIPWVSSFASEFNYDFHVSFTPAQVAAGHAYHNFADRPLLGEEHSGLSAFYRDEDDTVYHTFSAFGRGAEELLGTYVCLDLAPLGRNENGPHFNLTDWVRHHDRYDAPGHVDTGGRFRSADCCDGAPVVAGSDDSFTR